jgi:hypothetical protein
MSTKPTIYSIVKYNSTFTQYVPITKSTNRDLIQRRFDKTQTRPNAEYYEIKPILA